MDTDFLQLPFFSDDHRRLAGQIGHWASQELPPDSEIANLEGHCRELTQKLSAGGWLRYTVPRDFGGLYPKLDVRSLCIIRETLAGYSALADFTFAMQGLGAGPISFFGSNELRREYLPRVAAGKAIAAFAISESNAGSDVSAMFTTARREGSDYVVDGEKTWISNAGIADFYVVFCKLPQHEKKFVALVVDAQHPGLEVTQRIDVIAPHVLGTLRLNSCRVPATSLVGEEGKGLRVALGTLDVFRATVGAAALGMAKRAIQEAVHQVKNRTAFGKPLSDFQLTQQRLADMTTRTDASALLVYRAAWACDSGAARVTRETAMAKLHSTEAAQQTIDDAVQLLGAKGVVAGERVEMLYREIRALRIYEGTSEIQKLVIARQLLEFEGAPAAKPAAVTRHGH